MPSTTNLITFTLLALVIILVPGPGVLFAVGRALILGTKPALLSVLGNALGVGVQILLVALGLGVVIQQSEVLFFVIRVVGAGLIIYLGIKAIWKRADFSLGTNLAAQSKKTLLRDSVIVGLTNAKTFVFFIAALPSFTSPELGNPITQMLVMGVIFSSIGIVSDSAYAIAAGQARAWLAHSEKRLANFRGIGGLALTLLGFYMLYEALIH